MAGRVRKEWPPMKSGTIVSTSDRTRDLICDDQGEWHVLEDVNRKAHALLRSMGWNPDSMSNAKLARARSAVMASPGVGRERKIREIFR